VPEGESDRAGTWVVYAAATWAFVFAAAHLIWAAGWYVGLDQEQARIAFQKPLFLAYDLVVAAACAIAVPIALAPVRPWGRRLQIRPVQILAWVGTGLLLLRAGASIVQAIYLLAKGRFALEVLGIWEPWFYLGATLFGLSTWRFWRRLPERGSAQAQGPS